MSDADLSVRTAAVRNYGEVASVSGIPVLVDMLLKSTDDREIAAYERAIGPLCAIVSDKDACTTTLVEALAKARPPVKVALLRILQAWAAPVRSRRFAVQWTTPTKTSTRRPSV